MSEVVTTLLPLAGLVFVSFLVEAAAGFGSMVIALTLGALVLPVDALLGVLVPVNLVLSAWLTLRGRAHVDVRFLLRRVLPAMAVGLAVGTGLTRVVDASVAKPVFAVFVLGVATLELVRAARGKAGEEQPLPAPVRVGGLVGAGVVHGVFATGGPLVVLVSSRELADKHAFRATLSALWLVMNALVMPRLVQDGAVTATSLTTSALLLFPLGLGTLVGEWVHRVLDERRFKLAVAVLLLLAGAVLLVGSVRAP